MLLLRVLRVSAGAPISTASTAPIIRHFRIRLLFQTVFCIFISSESSHIVARSQVERLKNAEGWTINVRELAADEKPLENK